jgi:hypothetical protein
MTTPRMIDSQLDERSAELPLWEKLQRDFIELRNTSHHGASSG